MKVELETSEETEVKITGGKNGREVKERMMNKEN